MSTQLYKFIYLYKKIPQNTEKSEKFHLNITKIPDV